MNSFSFDMRTTLRFGPGVSMQAGAILEPLVSPGTVQPPSERRVLVVTDGGVLTAGLLSGILESLSLSDLGYGVFANVEPNPRDTTAQGIAGEYHGGGYCAFVAVGGGSVIDAAKGAALVATHGRSIRDYEGWETKPVGPLVPLIAIPTTAGTGSEVGAWAVISLAGERRKINVGHRNLAPAAALVDPLLTYSLPRNMTVATGFDALTHAIEAYTCTRANPISDGFARKAIRLIGRHLCVAAGDGDDEAARSGMMLASTLAGMAMDQSELGAVHCLSESLGGFYDAPHGLLNAILLPYVMAHNAPFTPRRYARVAEALRSRCVGGDAREAIAQVLVLGRDLDLPDLASLGVQEGDLRLLSERAAEHGSNASNPEPLTDGEYWAILEHALAGDLSLDE